MVAAVLMVAAVSVVCSGCCRYYLCSFWWCNCCICCCVFLFVFLSLPLSFSSSLVLMVVVVGVDICSLECLLLF